MRINIDIDDDLLAEALKATGLPTEQAVVEEALRKLIRLRAQHGILALSGKVRWTGDLDAMREGRLPE